MIKEKSRPSSGRIYKRRWHVNGFYAQAPRVFLTPQNPFPLVSSATLPFYWRALHSTRLLTPVWKTQPLSIFRFIDILTDFSNNFEGTLNWKIITRLIVSENEFTLYQSIALRQLYILTFGSETIGWSVWSQMDEERTVGSARHLPPTSDSGSLRLNFHPDQVLCKKLLIDH